MHHQHDPTSCEGYHTTRAGTQAGKQALFSHCASQHDWRNIR